MHAVDDEYERVLAASLPILLELRAEDFGLRQFITADPKRSPDQHRHADRAQCGIRGAVYGGRAAGGVRRRGRRPGGQGLSLVHGGGRWVVEAVISNARRERRVGTPPSPATQAAGCCESLAHAEAAEQTRKLTDFFDGQGRRSIFNY